MTKKLSMDEKLELWKTYAKGKKSLELKLPFATISYGDITELRENKHPKTGARIATYQMNFSIPKEKVRTMEAVKTYFDLLEMFDLKPKNPVFTDGATIKDKEGNLKEQCADKFYFALSLSEGSFDKDTNTFPQLDLEDMDGTKVTSPEDIRNTFTVGTKVAMKVSFRYYTDGETKDGIKLYLNGMKVKEVAQVRSSFEDHEGEDD
jgi:hypothetical protein